MRDIYEIQKEMDSSKTFRNCGIISELTGLITECDENTDEEDWNVPRVPPLDTLSTNERKDERWEGGFFRISTNGFIDYPEDQRLARGGAVIYFGKKQSRDTGFAVSGVDMNSYRTKLQAVRFVLEGGEGVGHKYLDHAG